MRACERCGASVPIYLPRKRVEGKKVCDTCAKTASADGDHCRFLNWVGAQYGVPDLGDLWFGISDREPDDAKAHALYEQYYDALPPKAKQQIAEADNDRENWLMGTDYPPPRPPASRWGSLQAIAHDGGDGATIYHCFACGSGNVVGRSDGSAECGHCKNVFTVQVQPPHPFTPQTINGQPYDNPDLPGQVTDPGAEGTQPGQPPVDEPDPGNESLIFKPPGQGEPFDPSKDQQAQQIAAMKRMAAYKGLCCLTGEPKDANCEAEGLCCYDGEPHGPGCPAYDGYFEDDPTMRTRPVYRTSKGAVLTTDDFLRHLAIRHADDREAVLERVRAER